MQDLRVERHQAGKHAVTCVSVRNQIERALEISHAGLNPRDFGDERLVFAGQTHNIQARPAIRRRDHDEAGENEQTTTEDRRQVVSSACGYTELPNRTCFVLDEQEGPTLLAHALRLSWPIIENPATRSPGGYTVGGLFAIVVFSCTEKNYATFLSSVKEELPWREAPAWETRVRPW